MINNISFGKKLVATCKLKTKDNRHIQGNIFELNKKDDLNYFSKLGYDKKWRDDYFLSIVNYVFLNSREQKSNCYVMENQGGDCLGYIKLLPFDDRFNVEYIETCPAYTTMNRKRDIKYVGKSLMAFVVELANKEKKEKVNVQFFRPNVKKFYKASCKFVRGKQRNEGLVLESKNFGKFFDGYSKKTGEKINFIE